MIPEEVIAKVRRFNRGWTEVLGLLDRGLLETDHSLAEARVLFELAQRKSWERSELRGRLDMDASFLTRVLGRLEDGGLVRSTRSDADGRAIDLALTNTGRDSFKVLNQRSSDQIAGLLAPLTQEQLDALTESMTIVSKLVSRDHSTGEVSLRGLGPGDLGWVVQRHGAIYADEYGWDRDFEALVAQILADYHENHSPEVENAWIAELEGARAGCVFCCRRDLETAQLRVLLVEPWARGRGIGSRLVNECLAFARNVGYSRITLWTNDVLASARQIYESAGFTLVEEAEHHSFGHDLVGQNWELPLKV